MKTRLLVIVLLLAPVLGSASRPPVASGTTGVRWGYYAGYDRATSLPSLRAHAVDLTHYSPWYGFQFDSGGRMWGRDDPEATGVARAAGAKVLPLVQNSARYTDLTRFFADPAARARLIEAIVGMVRVNGYDGVNVDIEGVTPTDRQQLTGFMAELAPKLRALRASVTMAVPAKTYDATTGWGGAYDYAALAPHVDLVVLMAYDYHSKGSRPGPVAPVGWVRSAADYATSQLGPEKVVVGLPLYGYDWNLTAKTAASTRYSQIVELAAVPGAVSSYDAASESGRLTYAKDGQAHEVWYEDARSLDAKLAVVRAAGVAGVGMWRLGQEDPRVWSSVRGLSVGASLPTFSPNGDRYEDGVAVSYRLTSPARTTVEALDGAGAVVRTLQTATDRRAGAFSLLWDGRDAAGRIVPDGIYTARVTSIVGGSTVTDTVRVGVDTLLRSLALARREFAPAPGALTGTYSLNGAAPVRAWVARGGRVVRVLQRRAARAAGTHAVSWDGRDSWGAVAGDGGYSIVVEAESASGRPRVAVRVVLSSRAPAMTDVRLASPRLYVNGATVQEWSYFLDAAATVELRLLRDGEVVGALRASQGAGWRLFRWDGYLGGALARPGTYAYELSAVDASGLRSKVATGSFAVIP